MLALLGTCRVLGFVSSAWDVAKLLMFLFAVLEGLCGSFPK